MNRRGVLGLALSFLWACQPAPDHVGAPQERAASALPAAVPPPQATPMSAAPAADPALEALATEYRALRAQPRSAATDKRRGDLLETLGRRLADGTHTRAEVERLMGPPDATAPRGSVTFARVKGGRHPPKGSELLVYHLRGGRDVFYFDCEGPKVLGGDFWFAGD